MSALPTALQLYSVRDHMDKNPAGTLERVKTAGYDYVELAGLYGLSPAALRQMLDDSGLQPVSTHWGFEEVTGSPSKAVSLAAALGVKFVVISWLGSPLAPDREGWLKCVEQMDAAGATLREAGIQLCYHNHSHEFEKLDGEHIFDLIYGNSRPENLAAQIDTCWVKYGGADPAATIRKYAGRCPLLHIKDCLPGPPFTFTELGRGCIEWPPVFAAGRQAGVQWFIVEQDSSATDSLESARISAEFMTKHQE